MYQHPFVRLTNHQPPHIMHSAKQDLPIHYSKFRRAVICGTNFTRPDEVLGALRDVS